MSGQFITVSGKACYVIELSSISSLILSCTFVLFRFVSLPRSFCLTFLILSLESISRCSWVYAYLVAGPVLSLLTHTFRGLEFLVILGHFAKPDSILRLNAGLVIFNIGTSS